MSDTKIQWTDTTWNVVTGCTKISAGCKNCYAERDWHRVYGGGAPKAMRDKYGIRKFTDVLCHEDRLNQPLRWQRPRMIFVNSMSDLFHEDVPVEFITSAFEVMRSSWRHTFQVLTKRPERMRQFMKDWLWLTWRPAAPLSNVWLGVSCEDQKAADERIPILLDTPAAVRFVSAEPLLSKMSVWPWVTDPSTYVLRGRKGHERATNIGGGRRMPSKLDWVIVGGESGPKARPCDVAWIRSIIDQCKTANVPCFVKQLGAHSGLSLSDRKGGDQSEWPEDLRVREWPT